MKKMTRARLEEFLARYRSDKRVLDVGSGGSSYDRFFPNRLAVDIDPARKPELIADVHNLPFSDEEFDMVLSTEVLAYTKDPERAIAEMLRVLKKDGLLILTTRFVFPLNDAENDYWRFTRYNLLRMFDGWEIVEFRSEMGTFSAIGALLQRIALQTTLRGGKFTKAILYAFVHLFSLLDGLIVEEFTDIKRTIRAKDIATTGYYIVVRKKRAS